MSNVCVYGSSSAALENIYFEEARSLGEKLAQNGYGLVFGAGDMGVMGAVARGVKSAGGTVIGVLPAFMNVDGIPYPDCDELILTETMRERKRVMEERSDGYIAAPGGVGTFEEFFEMLTLKQLKQHKKPIVLLNTNNYYDPLLRMMESCVSANFAKAQTLELYGVAADAAGAVDYLSGYEYKEFGLKWFTDAER